MQIEDLDDSRLIDEVKSLVRRERNLVIEILRYLREIESRALFLARGFPSLYDFCISELGYSNGEAHIRIQAMRLMRQLPSVEEQIENGDLSLTVAAAAQGTFRRQEKLTGEKIGEGEKASVIHSLINVSSREAEKKLVAHYPAAAPPKESIRSFSEDEARVTFVASKELVEKLERLKGLLAHQNFEGRLDILFEKLADLALEKLDPGARPENSKKKGSSFQNSLQAPKVRSRYIPPSVRSEVWKKARGQCEYVDEKAGRRCSSRYGLQIDHIHEYSKGGSNETSNLRLLCGAHNRWRVATSIPPPMPTRVDFM